MVTRRSFVAASAASAMRAQPAKRPNFLFLLADDHAGYVMGCDGDRKAETPNLDRLASEGTRFSANYCNSPVCTPSRQSILTGQLPHSAGVTQLATPLDPAKPTVAKHLRFSGYNTAVFGKMHLNQPGKRGLFGFDTMMTERELNVAWRAAASKPVPEGTAVQTLPWQPFRTPARQWLNAANLPHPKYEQDMRSAFQVREVSKWLEQNKDRPFALWVSFMEPHSPFDFPVEGRKFTEKDFSAPRVGPEDVPQIPLIFRELGDEQKRGIIAAYYNSARYLDMNIGRVLELLRRHNLEDNTFIVYMADHGYSLGQHGRFEKHCGYDPALRVPLLMRWPGHVRQGVVTDFTESVDVPHTILDMLGVMELPVRHGQSLRPYLDGRKVSSLRDHIFSEYLENEEAFVRTASHKLIFGSGKRKREDGYETDNPTPGRYVRLYDLKADPDEFVNVAAKNPSVVARLQKLMLSRFRSTHPEAQNEPARLSVEETIEWYLRPRDVHPAPA